MEDPGRGYGETNSDRLNGRYDAQACKALQKNASNIAPYSVVGFEDSICGWDKRPNRRNKHTGPREVWAIYSIAYEKRQNIANPRYANAESVTRAGGKQQSLGNARFADFSTTLPIPIPVNRLATHYQQSF